MDVAPKSPNKYQSCADAYNRCFRALRECSQLYLEHPNIEGIKDRIDLLMNFANLCEDASNSISTELKPTNEIIELCANLSDECKKCADVCRSM